MSNPLSNFGTDPNEFLEPCKKLLQDRTHLMKSWNIKTKDVQALLNIGVHGVAISSYFNENTESRIAGMLKIIEGNYAE